MGRENNTRVYKWIERKYLESNESINFYKVILPKAIGAGKFGEQLGEVTICGKDAGYNQTFIGIGHCSTRAEAIACSKYVKTRFARALLGILKVTQDNTREKWNCVPLQDFSPSSDIDWSKPVSDIDSQLYLKYGLSDDEIEFIESHIKPMD